MSADTLTLGQVYDLLRCAIVAGADPDLPVGIYVDEHIAFVDSVAVTDDEAFDVWIGGASDV